MQQTSSPSSLSYQYYWWELGVLCAMLLVGFVLAGSIDTPSANADATTINGAIVVASGIGSMMVSVAIIYMLVRDWYGFSTLRGWIQWSRFSSKARTWIIIAMVFLFGYAFLIYVVRTIIQTVQFYQQRHARAPLERKLRVATMEAQLGMLPTTEGTCQACHKPLQAGAEFCHSCGAPVKDHPQICPKCAATTFPDAKWCPMCGTPLTRSNT